MTVTFDPVRDKDTTRQQWRAAAWNGWEPGGFAGPGEMLVVAGRTPVGAP